MQAKIIALLVVLLVGFGSGFGTRAYIASHEKLELQVADLEEDKAEFEQYIAKNETQVAAYNSLQSKLYTIDVNNTKALNEQLAENARLAGSLDVAQRMRLQGASCVAGSSPAEGKSAGAMGSDLQVELSAETRRSVWDLRASIIQDANVIAYYQGYTEGLGLKPLPPTE